MTDLETLARTLRQYKIEYDVNNKAIADMKTRNDVIVSAIRNIHETIKQTPIQLDREPLDDYVKGERCWICNKKSYYRCFFCLVDGKPCGYCDNHTHKHKIEFPDHPAIFQRILQLIVDRPIAIKLSPEAEIEILKKRITELDRMIENE